MDVLVYILPENRVAFNQNQIDLICLLCCKNDETLQHFILDCEALSSFRDPIMNCIINACLSILFYPITLEGRRGTTDKFTTIPFHLDLFSAALVELVLVLILPT